MNKLFKGHLALLCANVIWGLYAPIGKQFMNLGIVSSWSLSGVKIIGAAVLLWVIACFLPESMQPRQKVEKKDYLSIFLASLLIIAGNQVFTVLGLSYCDPVHGAVLCSITPIFVLILSFILYKQTIGWLKILGVVLGFAGVMLFTFIGEVNESTGVTQPLLGDMLVVVAQLCGAMYLVMFSRIIGKYSAVTLMKWMFLFSALFITPITLTDMLSTEWSALTFDGWWQLAFITVFATCLAYLLLPIGQVAVKPAAVAMYSYLQPVIAAVFSVILGLSGFTAQSCIAAVLILSGVYIVSKPASSKG